LISDKSNDIKGKIYLFFDEIQNIPKWEKLVNSYFSKEGYDIYVTCSNSKLLSCEFATFLLGRYVKLDVYLFPFREYLQYYNITNDYNSNFIRYIQSWGMPSTLEYSEEDKIIILMDLYNSIILKDIVQRNNVSNIDLLDRIIRFIMYNIGQTFS
jgi:predicted AAA+ superfamily ATPase